MGDVFDNFAINGLGKLYRSLEHDLPVATWLMAEESKITIVLWPKEPGTSVKPHHTSHWYCVTSSPPVNIYISSNWSDKAEDGYEK
jgi:hypothetical protein